MSSKRRHRRNLDFRQSEGLRRLGYGEKQYRSYKTRHGLSASRDENIVRGRELLNVKYKTGFHTRSLEKEYLMPILGHLTPLTIYSRGRLRWLAGRPRGTQARMLCEFTARRGARETGYRVTKSGQVIHNPANILVSEALILDQEPRHGQEKEEEQ